MKRGYEKTDQYIFVTCTLVIEVLSGDLLLPGMGSVNFSVVCSRYSFTLEHMILGYYLSISNLSFLRQASAKLSALTSFDFLNSVFSSVQFLPSHLYWSNSFTALLWFLFANFSFHWTWSDHPFPSPVVGFSIIAIH